MFIDYLKNVLHEICIQRHLCTRRVYLFGANAYVSLLQNLLLQEGISVCGIIDNDLKKQQTIIAGLKVFAPNKVIEIFSRKAYFFILSKYSVEMCRQLETAGYGVGNDITVLENPSADSFQEEIRARVNRGIELYRQLMGEYQGAKLLLLECNSIGDPYFFSRYMSVYTVQKGITQYVFLFCRQSMKNFVEACDVRCWKVLPLRDLECLHLLYRLMSKRLNMTLLHKTDSILWRVCTAKQFNFLYTLKCYALGLPENTLWTTLFIQKPNWKIKYTAVQLPGVLLVPRAKSVYERAMAFWENLIAKLTTCGLQVYCNVGPGENGLPGTIPIAIAPEDIVSVCERIGCVIALRSGFCDMMSEARCKKIVLYNDVRIYSDHISEIDFFSLRRCGLCQNVFELLVSNDWQTDVNRIFALVNERTEDAL